MSPAQEPVSEARAECGTQAPHPCYCRHLSLRMSVFHLVVTPQLPPYRQRQGG